MNLVREIALLSLCHRFQNGICPRKIKKAGFSNSSDFWRVFRKLRFREHEGLKGHSQLWDRADLRH